MNNNNKYIILNILRKDTKNNMKFLVVNFKKNTTTNYSNK
jgi:hypothetical protein